MSAVGFQSSVVSLRPFVASEPVSDVKDNVAHPSAIGLHKAGKVQRSPSLQFPPSIGEGRLSNIPRFLSGSCHSLLFVDIWMPPYQVRGRLIKSGMTAYPGSGPGQASSFRRTLDRVQGRARESSVIVVLRYTSHITHHASLSLPSPNKLYELYELYKPAHPFLCDWPLGGLGDV